MKNSILVLITLLSNFILAQEKHFRDASKMEYFSAPEVAVFDSKEKNEYALEFNFEYGKEKQFKKQTDGISLFNQKKQDKADVVFHITVKEPKETREERKKEDGSYYYAYTFNTVIFVEVKKGGKTIDTTSFKKTSGEVNTMAAAPITIVDNYLKTPVWRMKSSKAKKNEIAQGLRNLSSALTKRYTHQKQSKLVSYNQYVTGAQGSTQDFSELNTIYNDYKEIVSSYADDEKAANQKLEALLSRLEKVREKKNADGTYYFSFMYVHDMDVLKLEILTTLGDIEEGQKVIDLLNADKKGYNTSSMKYAIKKFEELK